MSELLRINANYSSPADFGGMLYADGLSNGMKCPISKNDENPDGSVRTIRSPPPALDLRVRVEILGHARIKCAGKYLYCMV